MADPVVAITRRPLAVLPADASDTFVVGTEPQCRVIRCAWDHNNVGFTTLAISLFRRGRASGAVRGADLRACHFVGRPGDLEVSDRSGESSGMRILGPDRPASTGPFGPIVTRDTGDSVTPARAHTV